MTPSSHAWPCTEQAMHEVIGIEVAADRERVGDADGELSIVGHLPGLAASPLIVDQASMSLADHVCRKRLDRRPQRVSHGAGKECPPKALDLRHAGPSHSPCSFPARSDPYPISRVQRHIALDISCVALCNEGSALAVDGPPDGVRAPPYSEQSPGS